MDIIGEDLIEFIKAGAILIDVRSPQEFEEGHLQNAICIPDYDIRRNFDRYGFDKEQLIVVYCSNGDRSRRVQKGLERRGYINVYNLKINLM